MKEKKGSRSSLSLLQRRRFRSRHTLASRQLGRDQRLPVGLAHRRRAGFARGEGLVVLLLVVVREALHRGLDLVERRLAVVERVGEGLCAAVRLDEIPERLDHPVEVVFHLRDLRAVHRQHVVQRVADVVVDQLVRRLGGDVRIVEHDIYPSDS